MAEDHGEADLNVAQQKADPMDLPGPGHHHRRGHCGPVVCPSCQLQIVLMKMTTKAGRRNSTTDRWFSKTQVSQKTMKVRYHRPRDRHQGHRWEVGRMRWQSLEAMVEPKALPRF